MEDLEKAVKIVLAQYKEGTIDLTRVTQIEQNLVLALDTLAQARGEIGLALTQVYRALGGGWQIRTTGCKTTALRAQGVPPPPDGTTPAPDLESPAPRKLPPQDEKAPTSERRRSSGGFASLRKEP